MDETDPDPAPCAYVVSKFWTDGVNVAVTVLLEETVRLHWFPLTDVHPLQLDKVDPGAAAAVMTALVPPSKLPLHEVPLLQLTPVVLLERVPLPVPLSLAATEYTE